MKLIQCNTVDNEIGVFIHLYTEFDFYMPTCESWKAFGIDLDICRFNIREQWAPYNVDNLRPITYDPI